MSNLPVCNFGMILTDKDMLQESQKVKQKVAGSLKWSALMEAVTRITSPIIFVILALLLTPDDFGVMATAMIVISFAQIFWDAGLSKALIQTKENSENAADIIFWTNLCLGIMIYIILFLTANWIAIFFNSPASCPVLRVLGLQIIISSLSSVQQAIFVRDLEFRHLFWIKLITAIIPGIFSIPFAFCGYGVWALVLGALAGQMLNLFLLWNKSRWHPRMRFDLNLARKLFVFGSWVVGESFAAWFIMWGDNLLIGKFLGVHDLGVYRTGWMLVTVIFGLFLNPFLTVIYPTFSRLQDDLPALKNVFHNFNRVVMALALPMGIGILLTGPELVEVLFGNRWQGLGFVLSTIGLMSGMGWLVGMNSELYRAIGRPDVNTKLMLIAIFYYLPAYFIASQFGLKIFVMTRFLVAFVAIPIHIYLCMNMLKLSPFYLWYEGKNIILAALFMGIIIGLLKIVIKFIVPGLQSLILFSILILTGVFVYIGSLWVLDRSFIIQLKGQFRRALQC